MFRREPPLTDKVADMAFQEAGESVISYKTKGATLAPYLAEIEVNHLPTSAVKSND